MDDAHRGRIVAGFEAGFNPDAVPRLPTRPSLDTQNKGSPCRTARNCLAFYGGHLAYDIFLRYTDGVVYPAVVLNGGTSSLYYDTASPPVNAWQRLTVPLLESGWKVSGSGAAATQAQFKTVLTNLVGLYIYTEWHTGTDDTSVDNITMTPP